MGASNAHGAFDMRSGPSSVVCPHYMYLHVHLQHCCTGCTGFFHCWRCCVPSPCTDTSVHQRIRPYCTQPGDMHPAAMLMLHQQVFPAHHVPRAAANHCQCVQDLQGHCKVSQGLLSFSLYVDVYCVGVCMCVMSPQEPCGGGQCTVARNVHCRHAGFLRAPRGCLIQVVQRLCWEPRLWSVDSDAAGQGDPCISWPAG